jgi:hypothetical protein
MSEKPVNKNTRHDIHVHYYLVRVVYHGRRWERKVRACISFCIIHNDTVEGGNIASQNTTKIYKVDSILSYVS